MIISSGSPSSPESDVSGDGQGQHGAGHGGDPRSESISFQGRQGDAVGNLRRIVLAVKCDGADVTKV